jgi:hypothetical protein
LKAAASYTAITAEARGREFSFLLQRSRWCLISGGRDDRVSCWSRERSYEEITLPLLPGHLAAGALMRMADLF